MRELIQVKKRLNNVYHNSLIYEKLVVLIESYYEDKTISKKRKNMRSLNNEDVFLVSYADTIKKAGEKPLKTLGTILKNSGCTGVHILPFYESEKDRFSIIDHKKVDKKLGTWKDIHNLSEKYTVMMDLVMNHVSTKSHWFKEFIKGNKKYYNYFFHFHKKIDTSKVFRPQTGKILEPYDTALGLEYVWTTFNKDTVDLNYKNPDVLLEMIDVMLFYLSQGVEIIRLDSVAYIWKELQTNCLHLKKSYEIVKLLKSILRYIAPYAKIIVESDIPYKYNVKYLKKGSDFVYNTPLSYLSFDAFSKGRATKLSNLLKRNWALGTKYVFMNFLAAHNGIPVMNSKEFLNEKEQIRLMHKTKENGGYISYRRHDHLKFPFELNITMMSAFDNDVDKFLAAHAILLFSKGIPALYVHSLIGSQNFRKGVKRHKDPRHIGRESLTMVRLNKELKSGNRAIVYRKIRLMIALRKKHKVFDPFARQHFVDIDNRLYSVVIQKGKEKLLVIVNTSSDNFSIKKQGYDIYNNKDFIGEICSYGIYLLKQ